MFIADLRHLCCPLLCLNMDYDRTLLTSQSCHGVPLTMNLFLFIAIVHGEHPLQAIPRDRVTGGESTDIR